MKHKEIRKKLLSYIDAELPTEEITEIRLHLQQCRQCRRDIKSISCVWNFPKEIERLEPSPFLWNKISEYLNGKTPKEQLINKMELLILQMTRPALTAAIILLGLFIGMKIGNRLIMKDFIRQPIDTSIQLQSEFGLDEFAVLSPRSLGAELADLMKYENK